MSIKPAFILAILAIFAIFVAVRAEEEGEVSPFGFPLPPEEIVQTVGPEVLRETPAPSEPHPYVLFMAENNCKLRNQFKGARAFLHLEAGYYPNLRTKLVGGLPRIRFYVDKTDADNATIDPSLLKPDQMFEILQKLKDDPNHFEPKKSTVEVLIARETTLDEIVELFERFGIARSFDFEESLRPVIDETGEDRPGNRRFDHDEVLRILNPDHDVATPDPEYVIRMEEEEKRFREEESKKAKEEQEAKKAAASQGTEAAKDEL